MKKIIDCVIYVCNCCKQEFYYEKYLTEYVNFCPFCNCRATKSTPCTMKVTQRGLILEVTDSTKKVRFQK